MENVKLNKLIKLGRTFRHWDNYSRGLYKTWVKGERGVEVGLIDTMIQAKETIDELKICPKTSQEIKEFIDKIEKKGYNPDSDLDREDRKILGVMSTRWGNRILDKSETLNVFLLNYNYSLNPELLINGAKDFFTPHVWNQLSELAKRDLNECCKCIFFELPTPAGILALRATESVLRRYYEKKTNDTVTGFIDWNQILERLKSTNVDETLIGHLDFLRKNLRNKLAHPDSILLQKEAENVFSMIAVSIENMIKDS